MRDHTGCAGIMIARGSHGSPWIFRQARAALEGRPVPPDPDIEERFEIVLHHARLAIEFERDEELAMREFRKHLGWYTKGLPGGRELRQRLFQVTRLEEAEAILLEYRERIKVRREADQLLRLLESVAAGETRRRRPRAPGLGARRATTPGRVPARASRSRGSTTTGR